MVNDYYTRKRQAYLRDSASRHLRIVRLWREIMTPEFKDELWAVVLAGLVLGMFLADRYA